MSINTTYCYDYLRPRTEQSASVNHFSENPLAWGEYHDCYGLPYKNIDTDGIPNNGGGLEYNGNIVKGSALSGWAIGYPYNKSSAVAVRGRVIFLGFICDFCWGHAITDSLSHLWWFLTDDYKKNYSDCEIYYWSKMPLSGIFLELITAIIPADKLHYLDRITHFEYAFVPGDSFYRMDSRTLVYTKEYVNLIDWYISSLKSDKAIEKFYVIRNNESRQYACIDVEHILRQKGFVRVNPVEYSLQNQIALFHNAKEIVVEESSASHNLIFCKPGTKVTILRKCNYVNEYQAAINQMRNLDVTYIDCHLSVLAGSALQTKGPFFCYANELFCECFGVRYKGFPYREFRKWLNYHNWFLEDTCSRAERLQWDKNYAQIFAQELTRSRLNAEARLQWIKHLPLIPENIRERGFVWAVKKYVRGLM